MDSSTQSKCSSIPQRVVVGIMSFLGIVVSFLMRACLSVAITEMVIPMNKTGQEVESLVYSNGTISIESESVLESNDIRYDWSQVEQGWVLSSFFVGYLFTQVPAALLSQKYGGKYTLGLGILITAICNAAIPIGVQYGGLVVIIMLRAVMGAANGSLYPAVSVLLSAWVPEKERGKLGVFVLGGSQIGFLISFYVSGLILAHYTWPVVFYCWSLVAVIWFILFALLCYKDPASHPFISKEELRYLETEIGQLKRDSDLPSTPWRQIFTNVPTLVLLISQMSHDYVAYVLNSDLPKYMREVLRFSIDEVGLFSSLPFLLTWVVSIVSGFLCDHLINGRYLTTTQARKIFSALSSIFPSTFILAASYAEYNKVFVLIWCTLAFGFNGNYYPGLRVNILDLSPNFAGSVMAVINGISSLSGIAAPTFVGMLIPESSLEQWRFVFWVSFGISMVRTVIYTIWASAKVQAWNDPKKCTPPQPDENHELK